MLLEHVIQVTLESPSSCITSCVKHHSRKLEFRFIHRHNTEDFCHTKKNRLREIGIQVSRMSSSESDVQPVPGDQDLDVVSLKTMCFGLEGEKITDAFLV